MKAPSLTLSQRLLLLTAVALLPAVAVLGFNELTLRKNREAEIAGYAQRISKLASLEIERLLTGMGGLLLAVANSPVVQNNDLSACSSYMRQIGTLLPQIDLIVVTDNEGNPLCSNSDDQGDLDPGRGAELRPLIEEQIFAVGEYTETSRGPGLQMGTRRTGPDGRTTGYVLATIGLDYLDTVLRERDFPEGSALTIADRDGIIIARQPFPETFVGTQIPPAYLDRVMAPQGGTMRVLSQDGTERMVGYQPASRQLGLYVSAGVGLADAMRSINEATIRSAALTLVGALVAVFLALSFGRQFIQAPVLRLLHAIRAWRAGDLQARTGMRPGRAEFHQVGTAIDSLLDELSERQAAQEVAEQHRDLLARELDHRVKNLLATVQALARQTFKDSKLDPDQLEAFYGRLAIMADAHRLLTAEQSESADIAAIIETAIRPFSGETETRFSLAGPKLQLHAKSALSLAMAVHELCTNAVKYGALSGPDGRIAIGWALTESHQIIITWREQGGPAVQPPAGSGFGTRMIQRALAADLGATVQFNYLPEGLVCTIIAAETALAGRQTQGAGPFHPVLAVAQRS